jgi:hypothetical protein
MSQKPSFEIAQAQDEEKNLLAIQNQQHVNIFPSELILPFSD